MSLPDVSAGSVKTILSHGDFITTRTGYQTRYNQGLFCDILMVVEAVITACVAAILLSNFSQEHFTSLPFVIAASVAIGSSAIASALWVGGNHFDRFASRLTLLPTACISGGLGAIAALAVGSNLPYAGFCSITLFATIFIAKVPTAIFKLWMESTGRLKRLVAVVADGVQERQDAIGVLNRRNDLEIVFSGSSEQFEMVRALVRKGMLDEVVLAGNDAPGSRTVSMFSNLPITLVRIAPRDRFELPDFGWFLKSWQPDEPWTVPAAVLSRVPTQGWPGVFKRLIDLVGGTVALILLAPVMLACAAALKLESAGPVFFIQERAGYGDKPFRMFKFRSMYADRTDPTGAELTKRSDSRVTRVGGFMRRTSADELPQLFNVLIGDMSLVGPRPHPKGAKAGCKLYDDLIPDFYSRYRMKPGITGLAQISGLRGNTETEQHLIDRFDADLKYVAKWTPILDITILFRTVLHLIKATNAF